MAATRPLTPINLSYLCFGLIGALEAVGESGFPLDETIEEIRNGLALAHVEKEGDISLLDDDLRWDIEGRWRSLLSGYDPAKLGVQKNGLSLMLALTVELLQEGFDLQNVTGSPWSLSRLVEPADVGEY